MMNFVMKHKRAFIVGGAVLVLLVGGVWFLNNLPDFAVKMLINTAVSTNRKAKHFEEDALYVITTGTGAPLPDPNRAGPQTIVIAGDQILVFDAGPGSTRQLELIIDASSVDALFLTHYHSDHIGDMGELMLKRWATSGPAEPLPIYGPPGIEEVVAGFEAAYQLDKGYRIAHHGVEAVPPSGAGGEVHLFDLGTDLMASDVVYEEDGVQVIAFNVDHTPVFPAVGYRVTYKGKSVVISGDTIFTESLIHHSMGADVLVSEALNHEMSSMVSEATRDFENNASLVAEDIKDYHITPEQAGIVARDAGIPYLLITHVLPPVPNQILVNPFLRDARAIYDGEVYMANDGTRVKIPVDSEKITIVELLKK
ncbi:MAG: MBL fold metallo-hydrolase [Chloroflexi bacterium]|nr:MBL fold metallo-hydrolase [Chloroflexota bacterium]